MKPLPFRSTSTAVLIVLVAVASPVKALDVSGLVLLLSGRSEFAETTTDTDQQQYSLRLYQAFTPFLSARFSYNRRDLNSQTEQADPFTRRIEQPSFHLDYGRRTFSAHLFLRGQTTETSTPSQDIDSEAVRAGFNWRPTLAFTLSGDIRDETNVADVSVFGRQSEIQSQSIRASYERPFWGASYSHTRTDYLSASRFKSNQQRHALDLRGSRRFFNNRLSLNFTSNASRLDRQDELQEGAELVEPVPALDGLFAVDTSPEIGELSPNQGLNDGDTSTPAPPGIDIGGAATFRNLGLDLGIRNQVTRLEVSVDVLSGQEVNWQVYQSVDNLIWERVPGATSEFDEALLRYTLRFPQTVSRYLKAVNVSPNSQPLVQVTEIRALLDLEAAAPDPGAETTRYRAAMGASFTPVDRVFMAVDLGGSNDSQVSAGLVKRDFEERFGGARISIVLPSDFNLGAAYRFEAVDDFREPILQRTLETFSAILDWHPMPTLEAALVARSRDEKEAGTPLQSTESVGLELLTVLFPELHLISEVIFSSLTDEVSALTRDQWTFRERVEAQATPHWRIGGQVNYTRFDASEQFPLQSRLNVDLDTSWRISPYLRFNGRWSLIEDQNETFVQQSYNMSYVRGKLRLGGSFQQSDSRGLRTTQLTNASAGYRLNQHLQFDISMSSSQNKGSEVATTKNTSFVGSLRLSF